VESKPTLTLLNEIEIRIIRYIRNVARLRRRDKNEVKKIEAVQAVCYKTELHKRNGMIKIENLEKTKRLLENKKTKLRPKFGKNV